ncbi:peptide MFS transporter [Tahibacter harae]|uniref:Oligopeptide:H+ symporter n=1 Tax=Tahibacter harae TaxID=2963937 RepID=A0ABT1QXK3_9GAMM|nr:oligopeptide:H+ symporter [Tahibacter harae]MCQ4167016.1 oligopeptide:H+ symporter [Tahibacter harae]
MTATDTTRDAFQPPPPGEFLGHPRPLWMLFGAEFWERFAYYGMRAFLVTYVAVAFFNHLPAGQDRAAASLTFGAYTALIYATGLFGGFVADRYLGFRPSIMLGGLFMALGLFLLLSQELHWFLLGLATTIVGNGLFKPNISAMVGKIYAPGDVRRDSGFTIFYMGINAGGALAPFICGAVIGRLYGQRWGFFAAGVGMIFGLMMFHWLRGWLGHIGAAPVRTQRLRRAVIVTLGCIACIPVAYFLLSKPDVVGYVLMLMFFALTVYFLGSSLRSGDRIQFHRYCAMLLLFLAKILFWGMFEQAGSSLNFFAKDHVDSPFDYTLFQSFNPAIIIITAPMFAWLWPYLEKSNLNPSVPGKFAIALILVALGFTVLVLSITYLANDSGRIPWLMLALVYLLNTMGELCLSPIGLSMVSKLAAPKETGMAMGAWFLCSAMGNWVAGKTASIAVAANTGIEGYLGTYTFIIYAGLAMGVAYLVFARGINRLMHGVK